MWKSKRLWWGSALLALGLVAGLAAVTTPADGVPSCDSCGGAWTQVSGSGQSFQSCSAAIDAATADAIQTAFEQSPSGAFPCQIAEVTSACSFAHRWVASVIIKHRLMYCSGGGGGIPPIP